MMSKQTFLGASITLLMGATASAQDANVSDLTQRMRELYPNTSFRDVRRTPLKGIFEVAMGENIAYTDASGRFFMFGHLFDMQTQADLTASRQDEARTVTFPTALLGNAIKTVKGDGSRVVAVFSDPDCGYCKKLEASLAQMDNLTVYTFLFPLETLHPQAMVKAISIWCASNRAAAWSQAMLQGKTSGPFTSNVRLEACPNPINENLVLGGSLGVKATPTLIAADGRVLVGAASAEKLEQWLGGRQ
jgi:thiol:disulfide interchange protein DsbC